VIAFPGMSPGPETLPSTPDAPDAAWASALGVEPAALAADLPAVTPEEQRIIDAVKGHFAVSRPGPAAFPSVAMQILDLVRYPDIDLNELSRYIRVDGALAGGVLALANSAVYRAVRRIDTVKEAVARLGMSEVARLAAAISMKSIYSPEGAGAQKGYEPVWAGLFFHAASVARCASELAKQKVAPTPGVEQAFMAGLLHDVGKGVAMRSVSELSQYGKIPVLSVDDARKLIHRVHVDFGAEMHKVWQLPPTLAEVAAHHHLASPPGDAPFVHLVRLVSSVDLLRREPATSPWAAGEAMQSARTLKLGPARVKALGTDLETAEAWVKTVFPS